MVVASGVVSEEIEVLESMLKTACLQLGVMVFLPTVLLLLVEPLSAAELESSAGPGSSPSRISGPCTSSCAW
ncbi:hypothetical protein STEG23_019895 [Scotinomys teguina]